MPRPAFAIALSVPLGIACSGPLLAEIRDDFSHGTASCQSALPVFDGNIRKRPQAIANEGVATAFITCDSDSIRLGEASFSKATVYFLNRGSSLVDVSCTLVDGIFNDGADYFPKTIPNLEPGTDVGGLQWTADDNGGSDFGSPAISCALPPAVDIVGLRFVYEDSPTPE